MKNTFGVRCLIKHMKRMEITRNGRQKSRRRSFQKFVFKLCKTAKNFEKTENDCLRYYESINVRLGRNLT